MLSYLSFMEPNLCGIHKHTLEGGEVDIFLPPKNPLYKTDPGHLSNVTFHMYPNPKICGIVMNQQTSTGLSITDLNTSPFYKKAIPRLSDVSFTVCDNKPMSYRAPGMLDVNLKETNHLKPLPIYVGNSLNFNMYTKPSGNIKRNMKDLDYAKSIVDGELLNGVSKFKTTSGISFKMYDTPKGTIKSVISSTNYINVGVNVPQFEETKNIHYHENYLDISVVNSGLGSGSGELGNLNVTIQVQRLEETRFKFPSGYLDGLRPSGIASKDYDDLIIWCKDFGKTRLFTDKGTIDIICLPGYKINKSKEASIYSS